MHPLTNYFPKNADLFYQNLPNEVASKLPEKEWIKIARFIEKKLPQLVEERMYICKKSETKLPLNIIHLPKTKKTYIQVGRFSTDSICYVKDQKFRNRSGTKELRTKVRQAICYDVYKPKISIMKIEKTTSTLSSEKQINYHFCDVPTQKQLAGKPRRDCLMKNPPLIVKKTVNGTISIGNGYAILTDFGRLPNPKAAKRIQDLPAIT